MATKKMPAKTPAQEKREDARDFAKSGLTRKVFNQRDKAEDAMPPQAMAMMPMGKKR